MRNFTRKNLALYGMISGCFFLFLNHHVFLEKSNSTLEIAHKKTSWYYTKTVWYQLVAGFPRNFGVKHWYLKLLCRYCDFFQGLFSNLKLPGGTSVGVLAPRSGAAGTARWDFYGRHEKRRRREYPIWMPFGEFKIENKPWMKGTILRK